MERPDRLEVDRKQITAVMASLRREMASRLDSGLLPYEGRWVPLSDVQAGLARKRKQAWIHAIELVLFFCLNSIVAWVIILVVYQLCY